MRGGRYYKCVNGFRIELRPEATKLLTVFPGIPAGFPEKHT